MKKLLIAALFMAVASSCKKTDDPISTGYPTDDLTLEPKTNGLAMMMGFKFSSNISLTYDIFRKLASQEFPKRINHLSLVYDVNSPFYNPMADSLLTYYPAPQVPYYILNGEELSSPATIIEDVELALTEKPLASVAHAVSQDDTSWVVDSKVMFYDDTLVQPNAVLIETYMTADIDARVFGSQGLDLRFTASKDLVKNTDSASFWDLELYSLDSTAKVIKKGQQIVNDYIFLGNNNKENIFGTPLSSYWPFSGDYHKGDIIGTEDTPIRHHFAKLEKGEFDYNRKLRFVTVIWILNPMTSRYDYVNSYSTGSAY